MEILSVLTWLEIIDSAVKIGLGALIGAFATYFAVRETQKGKSRARRDQRKSDLIQKVAVDVESVRKDLMGFWVEWAIGVECADGELSAERKERLAEISSEIASNIKDVANAGATLMLLGLLDSVAALDAYINLISILIRQSLKAELSSEKEVEEVWANLNNARAALFASLSKDFLSDA